MSNSVSKARNSQLVTRNCFAWHGWELRVPNDWNAIKLEGDRAKGFALLADLESAKLGLRWGTLGKSADPARAIADSLRGEVGELAAKEAVEVSSPLSDESSTSSYYEEPEPPGRDVWIGYSTASNRIVQLIYHAPRRDRVLREQVLPELSDAPTDAPKRWSVLDLSCVTPAGYELVSQQLSAGDLRLTFANGGRHLLVRQVGPAELALARQPLRKWLAQHPLRNAKIYRGGDVVEIDGGLQQEHTRRGRFVLYRKSPRQLWVRAVHAVEADRIVIVESDDAEVLENAIREVGWARSNP